MQLSNAASAEPTQATLLDGRISFLVSTDWQKIKHERAALEVETKRFKPWVKCGIEAKPAPSLGRDQAQANQHLRQYSGPPSGPAEIRHHSSIEDRNGVSIYSVGASAHGMTFEGRQLYLIDGERMHVISATCFVWQENKDEALPVAMAFLDSIVVQGH